MATHAAVNVLSKGPLSSALGQVRPLFLLSLKYYQLNNYCLLITRLRP